MANPLTALQRHEARKAAAGQVLPNLTAASGTWAIDPLTVDEIPEDSTTGLVFREAEVDLLFAVEFSQKPTVVLGAGVDPNTPRVDGSMPDVRPVRLAFNTVVRSGVATHYIGMTLGCVITGPPGTAVLVDWMAFGVAYVGAMPTN